MQYPALGDTCPEEDKPSIFRLLMTGPAFFIDSVGVLRRVHRDSLSSAKSLATMDKDSLMHQFRTDTNHAIRLGLINDATAREINEWIEKYLNRRELTSRFDAAENKVEFFIRRCVLTNQITIRHKVHLLKRALTGR